MDHNELKCLELKEFKDTSHLLTNDKIVEEMMNRMELGDHKEVNVDKEIPDDFDREMLRLLSNCNLNSRKKGSWFTLNQVKELKVILTKFPDHQANVRKFLKISKTSFHRLREEIKKLDNPSIINRRLIRDNKDLSPLQKGYIRQLVKPPSVPLTLNEI